MYCDRCNIDFAEGLRYCKWCGQTLIERRRDTSELQTCPACSAAIKSSWAFCKSCGEPLDGSVRETVSSSCPRCGAATDTASLNCMRCGLDLTNGRDSGRITNSDAAQTAVIANCPSCGETLEPGSIYCKACGSALYAEQTPFGSSALLCSVCHSFSPLGSTTCRVCGALLIETGTDLSNRAAETISIDQQKSSTLPDLADHLPPTEMVYTPADSEDQTPKSQADDVESGAHTIVFSDSDSARLSESVEAPPAAAAPDSSAAHGKATSMLPGVSGSQFEQPAPTGVFNQTRITAPVDSESDEEAQPQDSTDAPDSARAPMVTRVEFEIPSVDKKEESSIPQGTSVLGSEPELRDTGSHLSAHRTVVFGSDSVDQEDELAANQWKVERPVAREEIMTAPFGLAPPHVDREEAGGTRVIRQDALDLKAAPTQEVSLPDLSAEPSRRANKEIPVEKETQVIESGRRAAIAQPVSEKKKSSAALFSIAALILLIAAASAVWFFMFRGERPAPRPQEPPVADATPAAPPTQPAAQQPAVEKPPAQAAPEGMALVASGVYIIGRDDGDPLEKPQRSVNLLAFFIDRTEVTNADYKRFVDQTGHRPPPNWKDGSFPDGKGNYPVTSITWQDASEYAAWAGKRLPTEIEWEAAARGSEGRIYPWGNKWDPALSNIGLNPKTLNASEYADEIKQVGQFPEGASPAGALDMIGNVWEWTADEFALYKDGIKKIPKDIASRIEAGKTYRVIRGGAFDGSEIHDASYRGLLDASQPYPKVGFRCVKDAASSGQ